MAFAGVAYSAQWQRHGDFTFGVQQESYDKNVLFPDLPAARLADHPPIGRVPVLNIDGDVMPESEVIAEYLAAIYP